MNQSDLLMIKGAYFSPCRTWRYKLWRIWDGNKPYVLFICLNPSTADEEKNDPTVERCMRFAISWGYGGLYVCNLFAYRSTDPKKLLAVEDPIGPENDKAIIDIAKLSNRIICAWGNNGHYRERDWEVLYNLQRDDLFTHCLRITKNGNPEHPLYLPKDLKPIRYLNINKPYWDKRFREDFPALFKNDKGDKNE